MKLLPLLSAASETASPSSADAATNGLSRRFARLLETALALFITPSEGAEASESSTWPHTSAFKSSTSPSQEAVAIHTQSDAPASSTPEQAERLSDTAIPAFQPSLLPLSPVLPPALPQEPNPTEATPSEASPASIRKAPGSFHPPVPNGPLLLEMPDGQTTALVETPAHTPLTSAPQANDQPSSLATTTANPSPSPAHIPTTTPEDSPQPLVANVYPDRTPSPQDSSKAPDVQLAVFVDRPAPNTKASTPPESTAQPTQTQTTTTEPADPHPRIATPPTNPQTTSTTPAQPQTPTPTATSSPSPAQPSPPNTQAVPAPLKDRDGDIALDPVDVQLPLDTMERPGTFSTQDSSLPPPARTLPQAIRTAAWFQMALAYAERIRQHFDGQALEVELANGEGTLRVETRRRPDHVAVSVHLSDPQLRALVAAHAERIQEALQAQYQTAVQFSLSGGGDHGGQRQAFARTSPHGTSLASSSDAPAPSPTESSRARIPRPGSRHEWIG